MMNYIVYNDGLQLEESGGLKSKWGSHFIFFLKSNKQKKAQFFFLSVYGVSNWRRRSIRLYISTWQLNIAGGVFLWEFAF
jgi:hypothetical protein